MMRILRALGASVLWIVAGVLGLVGVLLCATIILLPVGIPVLMLARRVFQAAMMLLLPRKARHPVEEMGKSAKKGMGRLTGSVSKPDVDLKPARKKMNKKMKKSNKLARSFVEHQRKRVA